MPFNLTHPMNPHQQQQQPLISPTTQTKASNLPTNPSSLLLFPSSAEKGNPNQSTQLLSTTPSPDLPTPASCSDQAHRHIQPLLHPLLQLPLLLFSINHLLPLRLRNSGRPCPDSSEHHHHSSPAQPSSLNRRQFPLLGSIIIIIITFFHSSILQSVDRPPPSELLFPSPPPAMAEPHLELPPRSNPSSPPGPPTSLLLVIYFLYPVNRPAPPRRAIPFLPVPSPNHHRLPPWPESHPNLAASSPLCLARARAVSSHERRSVVRILSDPIPVSRIKPRVIPLPLPYSEPVELGKLSPFA